jgi:hypothetical protein
MNKDRMLKLACGLGAGMGEKKKFAAQFRAELWF